MKNPAKYIKVNGHRYILASEVPPERVEKGGTQILIPGMRFPITLYKEQWEKLLEMKDRILSELGKRQGVYPVTIPPMRFPMKLKVDDWKNLFAAEDVVRRAIS